MVDDNGQYVLDKNRIVLVSNTKDLVINAASRGRRDLIAGDISLFGNPVFYQNLNPAQYNNYTDREWTQLPGTKNEVEAIASYLKTESGLTVDLRTNTTATETAIKELSSPAVLHIATHGFFLPNEVVDENSLAAQDRIVTNPLLRSGLLMANAGDLMDEGSVYTFNREPGVLTAYEAMSLNLDNTKIVLLSACETGRGDLKVGDGVYGLQRAILVAGSEAIIMSLFKVSDEATKRLMDAFYRNWIGKQMDKYSAFVEAKKTVREEFPDPIYWAAFIMVGSAS